MCIVFVVRHQLGKVLLTSQSYEKYCWLRETRTQKTLLTSSYNCIEKLQQVKLQQTYAS